MPAKYTLEHRIATFWSKVDKSGGVDACWIWLGAKMPHGYGRFYTGEKMGLAHRFSYELKHGMIPDGLFVCHSCDNPSCVNPTHLWLGTQQANLLDMANKGRSPIGDRNGSRKHSERLQRGETHYWRRHPEKIQRGEKHSQAKLNEAQVREIRIRHARDGMKQKVLAQEYGVSTGTISDILRRRFWKHI